MPIADGTLAAHDSPDIPLKRDDSGITLIKRAWMKGDRLSRCLPDRRRSDKMKTPIPESPFDDRLPTAWSCRS